MVVLHFDRFTSVHFRAFSTVETVESMFSIATNKPPPTLSVQEVIDCSYNNFGCQGGNTCMAAKWLKDVSLCVSLVKLIIPNMSCYREQQECYAIVDC